LVRGRYGENRDCDFRIYLECGKNKVRKYIKPIRLFLLLS